MTHLKGLQARPVSIVAACSWYQYHHTSRASLTNLLFSVPTVTIYANWYYWHDQPSLGLAPLIVKQIFAILKYLNKQLGLTIFLVEQNAHHALNLADRAYVMVNGRITMSGSGTELLQKEEVRAAYLEGGH